jgi:O-antigen biosynthesis protein WbqL
MVRQSFGLDDREIEFFDPRVEQVRLAQAIVPSLTIDSRIHSYNTVLFDRIRDSSGGNFGGLDLPNIFISRVMLTDKHSQNSGRVCKNEQEICAIAASEFGFAILAPETLPWREQIRVFSNARVVAGLFGSGLHTAVFCGQGARIGAIGALNSMQSAIASIRRQHNLYLGTNPPPPAQRFSVDPDQFRRFASILLSKQSKTP